MKKVYKSVKQASLLLVLLFSSFAVLAQDRSVSGTVKDEQGSPMPGVNVVVKGTSTGTATDASGQYRLPVSSANDVLVVSFIGYSTVEVAVGSQSVVDVSMQPDTRTLSELVVTGYATQDKRDITGSVAVVDTKDMTKIASSNIGDQLQGKIAGVQISSSGDPGSSQMVRIRGVGTINNNEPLYVIDGVAVQNEANMNFLNPNDVESMQVLKDAAAASIYGARAANGVVVITTKKGKAGKSKLEFDYYVGVNSPNKSKFPSVANPSELLKIKQGLADGAGLPFNSNFYINNGGTWSLPDYFTRTGGYVAGDPNVDPSKYYLNSDPNADAGQNYLIYKANKQGTDWFNEVFKPATIQNYQISASGGNDKGNYRFSGNYYDNNGILIKNFYKRYQMRMNSNYSIRDFIRVGESVNIAYQTTQASVGNPSEGSPIKNAYAMPQIVPVYDINGYFSGPAALPSNAGNPVAQQFRAAENKGHSLRVTGNAFGEFDFLKYFTFKTQFGLDYNVGPSASYTFRNFNDTEVNAANRMDLNFFNNRNWTFFNTVRFNREVGDHKISAIAGTEARRNVYEGFSAGGAKLSFGDDPNYRVLGNTDGKTYTISSYRGENRVQSYFAQANYSYADKYFFSGTIRRDGSSRFINNKYGTFPAASVGWRISKEGFMANVTPVTEMKLRASYGTTGNNETATGDYPGFSNFGTSISTANYDIRGTGNSNVPGFAQTSTGNPNLKWETTILSNVGVDATLFNKIDVTFEYFIRKTKDMIYGVAQPWEIGNLGRIDTNIGSMQNKGVEMAVNYRGKALDDQLNFTIGLTGTIVKNEVLALDANSNTFIRDGGSRIGNITYTTPGHPISQFYGYVAEGLWKSDADINSVLFTAKGDAKVGRVRFKDLNGDGQIDSNDETFIGNPIPSFYGGLNISANYKNFDLTLFLNGSYGQKTFNFLKYFIDFPAFQGNYSTKMLYEAGKTLPVLDNNDNYSPSRSTMYVENSSWTRLRNFQIGYTLPSNVASRLGMDKLRVYVQGQNLFTFTKYSGLDPDVTITNITEGFTARRDLSLGVDNGKYPWFRSFIFGVNIGL
ncbi:MAG: TonB-dependent receptor [Cyclobacteriaceae bacterium]